MYVILPDMKFVKLDCSKIAGLCIPCKKYMNTVVCGKDSHVNLQELCKPNIFITQFPVILIHSLRFPDSSISYMYLAVNLAETL